MSANLSEMRELTTEELDAASGAKNIVMDIGSGVRIVIQTGNGPVPKIWVCDPKKCIDTSWPKPA